MNADLDQLQKKIEQLAEVCRQLRQENSQLHQTLHEREREKNLLEQKLNDARVAIAALIEQLPEEREEA